ncbi:MAG TPA: zinc ribbon domain-containing protein [Candidatus Hydrogenedens sp.]|nr:zinc ribbon domain-containing protein [Candidatus Hydrogenedens sp.]HOL19968.1 zinc ribbon domain-containing protein [Candidatus Hydrogenedens sp.]
MKHCPYCNKPVKDDIEQCPHCGAPLQATTISAPLQTESQSQQLYCPNCKSPVNKTDIICIYCGTNLLTGTKIVQETPKIKRRIVSEQLKKYLIVGLVFVLLIIVIGAGIIFITYDPVSSAINLSRTNLLGAIDSLQKHIAKNPNNTRAHFVLGKMYLKNKQYDEAMAEFEKTFEKDKKNTDAVWLALYSAHNKKSKESQLKYLTKLVDLYPERNDLKLLSLLANPKALNNMDSEQIIALASSTNMKKEGIIALLMSYGNYDLALTFANTVSADSQNATLLYLLADMRKDENGKQKYMSIVETTTQGLSDADKALFACQLLKSGDSNRALQLLQTVKTKEQSPAMLNYLYALTLLNSGLTTEAIIELEKIKNMEGNYSYEATLDLAMIYFKQDNLTKATELIQAIKNKGQQSPRSYLIEGRIALANNDMSTAQQCFSSAIQKDPEYAPAYLENGLLYIRRNVLSEGLNLLKKYVQIVKKVVPSYSTAEIEVLMEQIEQTLLSTQNTQQQITNTQ